MGHFYGFIPQLPDFRDYRYEPQVEDFASLPSAVDLRPHCPPILNQLQLGSCVLNAAAFVFRFVREKEGIRTIPGKSEDYTPSRLFLYYNARALEGTISQDAGCQIRTGVKVLATLGGCAEHNLPYDISQFTVQPPAFCYVNASHHKVSKYLAVQQDHDHIRACLAAGYPVILGFTVYTSFESNDTAATGMVPLPQAGEQVLGGHAQVIVGYDDARQLYITANSWGTQWGDKGYAYFPYAYLENPNLSTDFWTIRAAA